MNTRTKETIINEIISYLEENEAACIACMEELDNYNGYLGDDRYFEMEELDQMYLDQPHMELLYRAFYGHDDDTWTKDSDGEKVYGPFNPNRDYFYYNGYGNLVSTDYKDYSDKLDHYAVETMSECRSYIDSIDQDPDLSALFDELDEIED